MSNSTVLAPRTKVRRIIEELIHFKQKYPDAPFSISETSSNLLQVWIKTDTHHVSFVLCERDHHRLAYPDLHHLILALLRCIETTLDKPTPAIRKILKQGLAYVENDIKYAEDRIHLYHILHRDLEILSTLTWNKYLFRTTLRQEYQRAKQQRTPAASVYEQTRRELMVHAIRSLKHAAITDEHHALLHLHHAEIRNHIALSQMHELSTPFRF